MREKQEIIDSKYDTEQKEPRSGRLRTSFLVIGSALLGGIAVALWNRRSLTDIQKQAREQTPLLPPVDDDAIY